MELDSVKCCLLSVLLSLQAISCSSAVHVDKEDRGVIVEAEYSGQDITA